MNRKEYMAASTAAFVAKTDTMVAHRAFYGQMVAPRTITHVVNCIGADRLLASTDPHLNDIPLHVWDRISVPLAVSFKSLGDYASKAGLVCVAKEAARQWIEAQS